MNVGPEGQHSTAATGSEPLSEDARLALQEARWAEKNALPDRALAAYLKLTTLSPGMTEGHIGLSRSLLAAGNAVEALAAARKALSLNPDHGPANACAGQACLKLALNAEAIAYLGKSLESQPAEHALRRQLGEALLDAGRPVEALAAFARVEEQFAADAAFLAAMAGIAHRADAGAVAERLYLRLLELSPQREGIYKELARLYMDHAQYSKARDVATRALQLNPDQPTLWNTLGLAQASLGLVKDALASYRKVLEIAPNMAASHSNMLLTLHYSTDVGPDEMAAEHRRWGRMHAPPALANRVFTNTPEPGKRLRVGYLSADFRRHSVAFFFESLLDHRNRHDFEAFCYGDVRSPDDVTQRIRAKADCYRNITGMHDRQVADLVIADGIDILVDLGGHAGTSRIMLLGYKPAPVQVSYCGYPDTTGIEAVDYRITDALADPPGVENRYTETLCRLPDGFLCYRPIEPLPELRPPPSQSGRPVTFGSFNNMLKVSQDTYDLWCRILTSLPESPMIMKSTAGNDPLARQLQLREFERRGITAERIQIVGFIADQTSHLSGYRNVDIALDTFPYHGTTTTLDALSMSVPVITLAGYNHASRVGVSLLTRIGLPEFISATPDEYVTAAVNLARSPQRIADLHRGLRARLLSSPLCDGPGFMRSYEFALRGMWSRWCRAQGAALTSAEKSMADFDFARLRDIGAKT